MKRTIIAFSPVETFQVRLPPGDDQNSLLHLMIVIRDTLDCTTEMNISSVHVLPDSLAITNLINDLKNSSNSLTSNPIVRLLAGGNQNTVGQVITALSQQFNKMNEENLVNAVSSRREFI